MSNAKVLVSNAKVLVSNLYIVSSAQLLEESKTTLQLWSLLSSIGSVAWSFQSNYARRKYEQMSYISRGIYFLYVLLSVTSRIIIIIMVSFNQENFFCIYIIIGCHMLAVILLDLWLNLGKYRQGFIY